MVEQTPTSVEQTKFSLLYIVEQNQTMVVEQNHTMPVEQTNVTPRMNMSENIDLNIAKNVPHKCNGGSSQREAVGFVVASVKF